MADAPSGDRPVIATVPDPIQPHVDVAPRRAAGGRRAHGDPPADEPGEEGVGDLLEKGSVALNLG